LLAHVDAIRLDHFRGFAAAWHVPAAAPSAQVGEWAPGPGAAIMDAVQGALGGLPFLAEDLGIITPDVSALRDAFHIPGTRVLQFAFDGDPANPHLPGNYVANTVVYTGTHDNPTSRGWYEGLPSAEQRRLWRFFGRTGGSAADAAPGLLELAWKSPAALAIAPFQDVVNLGNDARMNKPGSAEGNWRWRATEDLLSDATFAFLRELTAGTGRSAGPESLAASVSVLSPEVTT
jgi:4-alpha-glucanotransferase